MARKKKQFVVTVDDDHVSKINEVAQELRAKGMDVESVMEATGMISGSYSKSASGLEKIPGVLSVEEPPQIQLPPPGSPVQ